MCLNKKIEILFIICSLSAVIIGEIRIRSNNEHLENSIGMNDHENSLQEKIYECDFQNGLCDFLQNSLKNVEDWKIGQGKLSSNEPGPSVDHTLGTANGRYLFVNTSAAKSSLVSLQTIPLKETHCVSFFYHKHGADTGELNVEIHDIMYPYGTKQYFSCDTTQGDRWIEARFVVKRTSGKEMEHYRVIFMTSQKSSFRKPGIIALDDIKLERCNIKDAMQLCSFEENNCGYEANSSPHKWKWKPFSPAGFYSSPVPEFDHTLGIKAGGFWYCKNNNSNNSSFQCILRSPTYDIPTKSINCLQFFFYLVVESSWWSWTSTKEASIQARIYYPDSNSLSTFLTTEALSTTNDKKWNYAEAKVNITSYYQFQFTAVLDRKKDSAVAIDDVKLIPGRCQGAGFCDFEEGTCSWKNGKKQYKWKRSSGSSILPEGIGPTFDNTVGTKSGYYIMFSSRNKPEGSEAVFESEIFPPEEEEFCLTFYYQMKGKYLGTLKVIKMDRSTFNSTLWLMRGNQTEFWKKGMAIIQPSVEEYQIVFQGVTGNGNNSFMAIDDISIRKGEKCEITPPEAKSLGEDFSTTNEPLNHTNDISITNELYNYTYDFNTTYEPANTTYDRYVSTPEPKTTADNFKRTTLKPDICDPRKCSHGKCEVTGMNYRCKCDEGYTGFHCDQIKKQTQSLWFIVLAVFNISILLLLIGIFYVVYHIRRSMG
ncbi:MAM and LDL-receptor class A domain-containing protein 1 [Nephila pilipes]|uniref:MAM and LDL-receptor class A domain-containing protein 1 n=1 Tax=Nephila pilipes TaxID=299642 RepID=A0A8X6UJG9_NEPPI|nr:MAM and LDL-receptor class A domain-containing protein 1 [Nephila pilipes]